MANPELAFEHQVIRPLKALKLPRQRWLLAVSGGVDSMVLAEVLYRWRQLLKAELVVAYVHHGSMAEPALKRYRLEAQKSVANWCREKQIRFLTNRPEKIELKTEEQLRLYRQEQLENWAAAEKADLIVFAHHRDDLLETQLLRLIRGTSAVGLRGMRLKSGKKLRPLLNCSRAAIEDYAEFRQLTFKEDPSNRELNSLRNWLRHEWLPQLEQRQKGATRSLARSLVVLANTQGGAKSEDNAHAQLVGLRRKEMKKVSSLERERVVADYLRGLGVRNYGQNHVREILKRIDTRQKNLSFEMLGIVFQVTPDLLWASRV